MKNLLFLSLFFVVFYCSCNNNESAVEKESTVDKSSITNQGPLTLTTIDEKVFQDMKNKRMAATPIDRLCNESKGYKKHEWQGLNECDWAVEKYNIEQHHDLVERIDNNLNISLANQKMVLTHKMGEGQQYQFKGYSKKNDVVFVDASVEKNCTEYWLIDRKSGKITTLKGTPIFNKMEDAFMVSTASPHVKGCKNELEYWQLNNGVFTKTKSLQPQQMLYNLVCDDQDNWLASTQNPTSLKTDFVKISWK